MITVIKRITTTYRSFGSICEDDVHPPGLGEQSSEGEREPNHHGEGARLHGRQSGVMSAGHYLI